MMIYETCEEYIELQYIPIDIIPPLKEIRTMSLAVSIQRMLKTGEFIRQQPAGGWWVSVMRVNEIYPEPKAFRSERRPMTPPQQP